MSWSLNNTVMPWHYVTCLVEKKKKKRGGELERLGSVESRADRDRIHHFGDQSKRGCSELAASASLCVTPGNQHNNVHSFPGEFHSHE